MKQMSIPVRLTVVALLLCLAGSTALAQKRQDVVDLSVALRAEYTDNRDSVADDDPAKASTWDLSVSPQIDLLYNIQLTFFRLEYAPRFRHRTNPRRDQNENEWLHDLRARIDHESGRRLSWRLENRFSYTDDPEVTIGDDILRSDLSYYYNRLTLGANYALTRRSNLDLEGGYDLKRYDELEPSETSDEDRYRAQIRLQRQHNANLGYSVLARMFRIQREDALDLNRDFDTYALGAGVRNVFAKRLVGEVDAGYQWIEYDDSEIGGESSPFVQGRLTYRATSRTSMFVGGSYAMIEAYNYPYASQDMRAGFGGFEHELLPRVRIGGQGEYRVETYEVQRVDPDTPDSAFQEPLRDGDTTRLLLSAWVGLMLRDGLDFKVRHYHEDVDSDVSTSFTRNMTRFELRASF